MNLREYSEMTGCKIKSPSGKLKFDKTGRWSITQNYPGYLGSHRNLLRTPLSESVRVFWVTDQTVTVTGT